MVTYLFTLDVSADAENEEEARKQIVKDYNVSDDMINFIERGQ